MNNISLFFQKEIITYKRSKMMIELEEKFGFEYPELYKKLSEDGMLDWGLDVLRENRNQWEKEIVPKLLKNPPFLFTLPEELNFTLAFELISLTETKELLDNPPWPAHYKFVPFAKKDTEVYYAFIYQIEEDINLGEDIPIGLIYADTKEGEIVAKNLKDFIFRHLLEHAVGVPQGVDHYYYQEALIRTIENHKNYIPWKQFTRLQSIFKKPITKYKTTPTEEGGFLMKILDFVFRNYLGMISYEEFGAILQQEIGLERLDEEIMWD